MGRGLEQRVQGNPPGFGAWEATALQLLILHLSFLVCKMRIIAEPSLWGMMGIKLCVLYEYIPGESRVPNWKPGNLIFDSLFQMLA